MITLGINKLDNQLNTKPQFIAKSSQKKNNNTCEIGANNMALKQSQCSARYVSCLYVITHLARWRNPQYFGSSDETWVNKARISIITTCIDLTVRVQRREQWKHKKISHLYTHRTAWLEYLKKPTTGQNYNVLWNDHAGDKREGQTKRVRQCCRRNLVLCTPFQNCY